MESRGGEYDCRWTMAYGIHAGEEAVMVRMEKEDMAAAPIRHFYDSRNFIW